MKRVWLLWGLIVLFSACKHVPSKFEDMQQECKDIKAKAILWVDKAKGEKVTDWGHFRNVKIKAYVHSDGTFRIMSWCKKPEKDVVAYLEKRVSVFQIDKFFFDEGYLEPGEQYLQLKYVPEKVNRR